MAVAEVVAGAGQHVADADGLRGLGVGDQALVGEGVLPVEMGGERVGGTPQLGVHGHVADAFAVNPDLARSGSQARQELIAVPSTHVPTFSRSAGWRVAPAAV